MARVRQQSTLRTILKSASAFVQENEERRKLLRYQSRHCMTYLSTAIGLTPGGSAVNIYTKTINITTQITTEQHKYIKQVLGFMGLMT